MTAADFRIASRATALPVTALPVTDLPRPPVQANGAPLMAGSAAARLRPLRLALAAAVLALASAMTPQPAQAQTQPQPAASAPSGNVSVEHAWTRATVGAQRSTGAFFSLTASEPMKLIGVESAAADIVEIHEMALVDNIMRMRQVDAIPLAAGERVDLKPGGYHVMLIDLRKPVQVGDTIALTLLLEDPRGQRQTVVVDARARPLTDTGGPAADHGGNMGHGANMNHGSNTGHGGKASDERDKGTSSH